MVKLWSKNREIVDLGKDEKKYLEKGKKWREKMRERKSKSLLG